MPQKILNSPNNLTTRTGRIVEWHATKGYGFVDDGKGRTFVHIRDFAENHKSPEVGEIISYALGVDAHGRTCAKNAVHQNVDGRIHGIDWLLLIILLIAPGLLCFRLAEFFAVRLMLGWLLFISLYTYFFYAADKKRARERYWRFSENQLHFLALLGGWPGAFLAQLRWRHKISKFNFQFKFWLIVASYQFVAIDWQFNWRYTRQVLKIYGQITSDQR